MYNKTNLPLNFEDLNLDVQQLILESLDFDDLLSLSETSQYFSSLAVMVFKRRFSHKFVEIKSEDFTYNDDAGRIYLRDEENSRRILKQFGHSIYKLKVNYFESSSFEQPTIEAMSKLINLYCTEALTDIVIADKKLSFLSQITNPFQNVVNVELSGQFQDINSNSLRFDEIFPAIKSLFLSTASFGKIESLFQHFPNLIEFRVNFYDWNYMKILQDRDIEQVLRMNPQIRRLELNGPTVDILRAANDILINLEYLRIEPSWYINLSNDGPVISLKNVKILALKPTDNTMNIHSYLDGVRFENVEELYALNAPDVEFIWWISFIEKSVHLKKFHHVENCVYKVSIEKFAKIRNKKLKDVSLSLGWDVENELLVDFMNGNQNVEKFHFKFNSKDDTSFLQKISALRHRFSDKWTIETTVDSITLEKIRA